MAIHVGQQLSRKFAEKFKLNLNHLLEALQV